MTEETWLLGNDPQVMLRGPEEWTILSERKCRLFAVACCRRISHLLTDERIRTCLDIAERFADGRSTVEDLNDAVEGLDEIVAEQDMEQKRQYGGDEMLRAQIAAISAVSWLMSGEDLRGPMTDAVSEELVGPEFLGPALGASHAVEVCRPDALALEREQQAHLLRDIFGTLPFRPITLSPLLLTRTVIQLAQTIYDERRFTDMPVLADALEEAGCDNAEVLTHCRSGDGHVRGCWVVDLVLGQS